MYEAVYVFNLFQMSRVPGYEQRLKSILFKANFHEKIDEMREVIFL